MDDLLRDFAARHSLKLTEAEGPDESPFIEGQWGSVYYYASCLLAAYVNTNWMRAKKEISFVAGGSIIQNGDTEGVIIFDPHNKLQETKVIKYVGLRREAKAKPDNTGAAKKKDPPLSQRPIEGKC